MGFFSRTYTAEHSVSSSLIVFIPHLERYKNKVSKISVDKARNSGFITGSDYSIAFDFFSDNGNITIMTNTSSKMAFNKAKKITEDFYSYLDKA